MRVPLATALALLALAASPAGAAADQLDWDPEANVENARTYAENRLGGVSFALRTKERLYGSASNRQVRSASVIKAMMMVAYLNHPNVAGRALTKDERRMLSQMIRRSSNSAATRVRNYVGDGRLVRLAERVGMTNFTPNRIWGYYGITAADQTLLFRRIDRYVVERHREQALAWLAAIVPEQRWGIGKVEIPNWDLYFKGGWGDGSGSVNHQVALLRRGTHRVSVAVMTTNNPSHAYGAETLRGTFKRLLKGLTDAGAPEPGSP